MLLHENSKNCSEINNQLQETNISSFELDLSLKNWAIATVMASLPSKKFKIGHNFFFLNGSIVVKLGHKQPFGKISKKTRLNSTLTREWPCLQGQITEFGYNCIIHSNLDIKPFWRWPIKNKLNWVWVHELQCQIILHVFCLIIAIICYNFVFNGRIVFRLEQNITWNLLGD